MRQPGSSMKLETMALAAKRAARPLAQASTAQKNAALRAMARALRRAAGPILKVNAVEVAAARKAGATAAFVEIQRDRGHGCCSWC